MEGSEKSRTEDLDLLAAWLKQMTIYKANWLATGSTSTGTLSEGGMGRDWILFHETLCIPIWWLADGYLLATKWSFCV